MRRAALATIMNSCTVIPSIIGVVVSMVATIVVVVAIVWRTTTWNTTIAFSTVVIVALRLLMLGIWGMRTHGSLMMAARSIKMDDIIIMVSCVTIAGV